MVCGIVSIACGFHSRKFVDSSKDIWNDWRRSPDYSGRCALRKGFKGWKLCFRCHRAGKTRVETLLFFLEFLNFGKLRNMRSGELQISYHERISRDHYLS